MKFVWKNSVTLCVVMLVAVQGAFAMAAVAPPPNLYLVVPGKSVGTITLGMSKDIVKGGWGVPEEVLRDPDRYLYKRYSTTITFDADNTVRSIRTWLPAMKTREGIGVGSVRSDVLAAFGPPQEKKYEPFLLVIVDNHLFPPPEGTTYSNTYRDFYHTRGISFISEQRVRYIGKGKEETIGPSPS